MTPGGTLLIVAGVWVLAQVFRGNALGRLGITGAPDKTDGNTDGDKGTRPLPPGTLDKQGRPY